MPNTPSSRRRRRWLILGLVALAVGCAVIAGRAATGGGSDFTIKGDLNALLQPGTVAQPIDLAFSNPNAFDLSVSGLTVSIASVDAPAAREGLPCTTADFAVTQFSGTYPFQITAGASTLDSSGQAQAKWPTVEMVETHHDQDGCQGATVRLKYAGDAFNPDQPVDDQGTTTNVITTTTTIVTTTPGTTQPTTTTPAPLTPPLTTGKGIAIQLVPTVRFLDAGQRATFKVSVRNTSGSKLVRVTVADPSSPACNRTLGVLAAGQTRTYICFRPNLRATFTNTATAAGATIAGKHVSATAAVRVQVAQPQPALQLQTLPLLQTTRTTIVVRAGTNGTMTSTSYGTADFRIRVTNAGGVALHGVRVLDPLVSDCDRRIGALAPGAVRTYRCVAIAVRSGFTNLAVANGAAAGGAKVTAAGRSRVDVKIERKSIGAPLTPPKRTKVEVVLTIPDVLFAFNKSEIRPGSGRILAAVLATLQTRYPNRRVVVTGYTDSVGSAAYNLDLSRSRAAAVAAWLEQHGFPGNRLGVAWKGEADPVASNATDSGRQKNRRVTITVKAASR